MLVLANLEGLGGIEKLHKNVQKSGPGDAFAGSKKNSRAGEKPGKMVASPRPIS